MSINQLDSSSNGTHGEDRYLLVSCDTHAGPSLTRELRPYCPKEYLDDFDQFAGSVGNYDQEVSRGESSLGLYAIHKKLPLTDPLAIEATERTRTCPGQADMTARLRHMNEDGVAAEVIFAGGANGEVLPFQGSGFSAGLTSVAPELRVLGNQIWNDWLADFVSSEPHRHVGVMQVPVWDVDKAVREVRRAYDRGLRAVNLPAPRPDFPAYNDPIYDPFWAICEELSLPLETHASGGQVPLGMDGPGGMYIFYSENYWMCTRSLWQMVFGGVFDRFPRLKLVYTEIRVGWIPETIRNLDSIYENADKELGQGGLPLRRPSEYWADNCFVCGSFLARFEAELYEDVGRRNLMWGTDYPHREGTWPSTHLALRNTFSGMPPADVERILGLNALEVFNLDAERLQKVAQEIGPSLADLMQPLAADEFPAWRGRAFRKYGVFA